MERQALGIGVVAVLVLGLAARFDGCCPWVEEGSARYVPIGWVGGRYQRVKAGNAEINEDWG